MVMLTLRIAFFPVLFLSAVSLSFPCLGNTDAPLPSVTLLELGADSEETDGLFLSIRAQLSGAALTLKRFKVDISADREKAALLAASSTRAAVVFWVEDQDPARVFFYIPSKTGGTYLNRTLNIEQSKGVGRYEVIGIAAAGMLEGVLVSHRREIEAAEQPLAQASARKEVTSGTADPNNGSAPTANLNPKSRTVHIEFLASYSGMSFATDTFGHGVRLGIGLLPIDHLVLTAAFCMTFPMRKEDEWARLTVLSRTLFVSIAGRLPVKDTGIEFRPGASYTVDFRSFSTLGKSDSVDAALTGFRAVHGVNLFLSLVWFFKNRFGLYAEGGADIAMNETDYTISVDDTETIITSPFLVKAMVQAGIILQL
jgi:hypothetical protein